MAVVTVHRQTISWHGFQHDFFLRIGATGTWEVLSREASGSAVTEATGGQVLFFLDSQDGVAGTVFPTGGHTVNLSQTGTSTYTDLPDAEAGEVDISNPISTISEEAIHDFDLDPFSGGIYDSASVAWTVRRGGGTVSQQGRYVPPDVSQATAGRVRATVTFRGEGRRAKNGTTATATADVDFTIETVQASPTLRAILRGPDIVVLPTRGDYEVTVSGTATGDITYEWQARLGTSGTWVTQNSLLTGSENLEPATAGVRQVRVRVTRDGTTVTSNVVTTEWINELAPPNLSITNTITSLNDNQTHQFGYTYPANSGHFDAEAYHWEMRGGPGTIDQAGLYRPADIQTAQEEIFVRLVGTYRGENGDAPIGRESSINVDTSFMLRNPPTTAPAIRVVGPTRVREDQRVQFRLVYTGGNYDTVNTIWDFPESESPLIRGTIDSATGLYTPADIEETNVSVTIQVAANFDGAERHSRANTPQQATAIFSFIVYGLDIGPEFRGRVTFDGSAFTWQGLLNRGRDTDRLLFWREDPTAADNYQPIAEFEEGSWNSDNMSGSATIPNAHLGSRVQFFATGGHFFPMEGYVILLDQYASFGEAAHSDYDMLDIGVVTQVLAQDRTLLALHFSPDLRVFFGNCGDGDQPVYLNQVQLSNSGNISLHFSPRNDASGSIDIPDFARFHLRIEEKANPSNGFSFRWGELEGGDTTNPYNGRVPSARRAEYNEFLSRRQANSVYELRWNRNYPVGVYTDFPAARNPLLFDDSQHHNIHFGRYAIDKIYLGDTLLYDGIDPLPVPIEMRANLDNVNDLVGVSERREFGDAAIVPYTNQPRSWSLLGVQNLGGVADDVIVELPAGTYRIEISADVELPPFRPSVTTGGTIWYYFTLSYFFEEVTGFLAHLNFVLSGTSQVGERKIVTGGATHTLNAATRVETADMRVWLNKLQRGTPTDRMTNTEGVPALFGEPPPKLHAGTNSFVLIKQVL